MSRNAAESSAIFSMVALILSLTSVIVVLTQKTQSVKIETAPTASPVPTASPTVTPVMFPYQAFVSVLGNDTTAVIGSKPFRTIGAAMLAAAAKGPPTTVMVGAGVYEETLVIPAGVVVRGISPKSTIIQKIGMTTDTDLVTMGEDTLLESVTLILRGSANLRAIVWPGTTSFTAKTRIISIDVLNTGNGNAYALHAIGTMYDPTVEIHVIRSSTIRVISQGSGIARGLLISSETRFCFRDVLFVVNGTNSIGVETNHSGAISTIRTSTVSGQSADISQTQGLIAVSMTDLVNANANNIGFSVLVSPVVMTFGDVNTLANSQTLYFYPGSENVKGDEIFLRFPSKLIVRSISVAVRNPGTTSRTDVFTVRKNGVNTPVTVSVNYNDAASAISEANSVGFAAGDLFSLQVVTGGNLGTIPGDVTVVIGMY